ncbi:hypothetical protein AAMO2058_000485700 [Amorphochlora amoebiformis]
MRPPPFQIPLAAIVLISISYLFPGYPHLTLGTQIRADSQRGFVSCRARTGLGFRGLVDGRRMGSLKITGERKMATRAGKGFGSIESTKGGKLDDWDEWMKEMEEEERREKEDKNKVNQRRQQLVKEVSLERSISGSSERLNKVLAHWGVASRRGSDALVMEGRVKINGKPVTEPGVKVNPNSDIITVDGKEVTGEAVVGGLSREAPKPRWVLLYKPKGVTVTPVPGGEAKTVLKLVEDAKEDRLLPVGRLDRNTAGLILLTNEKQWLNPLTSQSSSFGKRYVALVEGVPKPRSLSKLLEGVRPEGYPNPVKPTSVEIKSQDTIKRTWTKLEIGFSAGFSRPRDIRKALDLIGHPLKSLTRTAIGSFQISKHMKAGDWRDLGQKEIEDLKQTLRQKIVKANPSAKAVATDSDGDI